MRAIATLAVVALLSITLWKVEQALVGRAPNQIAINTSAPVDSQAATPFDTIDWQAPLAAAANTSAPTPAASSVNDKDGLSNIGDNVVSALIESSAALQDSGQYSQSNFAGMASDIASTLQAHVSYTTYKAGDIKTDSDVSYPRMLKYRDDMRVALAPLLQNPGYELKLFSSYLDTKDMTYLTKLKTAAHNYTAATTNTLHVTVPHDALSLQLGAVNALSQFGALVQSMAEHADDGFAGAALLRSYGASEQAVLNSFNALAQYQKSKTP